MTSYRDACTTEGLFTRIAPFTNLIMAILKKPPPTPTPPPTFPTFPSTVSTTLPPEILGMLYNIEKSISVNKIIV